MSEGRSSGCRTLDFVLVVATPPTSLKVSVLQEEVSGLDKATYLYIVWIFIWMLKMESNSHMDVQIVIYIQYTQAGVESYLIHSRPKAPFM